MATNTSIRKMDTSSQTINWPRFKPSGGQQGISKERSTSLRTSRTKLEGTLPKGALRYFSISLAGRYYAIPCSCPFCGDKPPEKLRGASTADRRKWQLGHMAAVHVKGELPMVDRVIDAPQQARRLN